MPTVSTLHEKREDPDVYLRAQPRKGNLQRRWWGYQKSNRKNHRTKLTYFDRVCSLSIECS